MFVMTMHWQNYLFSTFVILLISSLSVQVAVAQDDAVTGEDLEPLFPEMLGNAALQNTDTESEPRVNATYVDEEAGIQLQAALGLGEIIDEAATELGAMAMMGATEADPDEFHSEEWSIQGHTLDYLQIEGNSIVFAIIDQFLFAAMAQNMDDAEALREMIEDYDFSQLTDWESPGEYAKHSVSPDFCLTMNCFAERVASCEPAQAGGQLGRNLGGFYSVEEPADDGMCLLSFMFTANPNEELIDQKVFFAVDRDADIAGNFQEEIMGAMQACMEGDGDTEHCGGPLLDMMQ